MFNLGDYHHIVLQIVFIVMKSKAVILRPEKTHPFFKVGTMNKPAFSASSLELTIGTISPSAPLSNAFLIATYSFFETLTKAFSPFA